jgi:membrane dipeptidase
LYLVLALLAAQRRNRLESMNDEQLRAYADELAHKFIIADGHVDFPERLKEKKIVLTEETKSIVLSDIGGEFDYERSKKGGLTSPFMSIYIPSSYQKQNDWGKTFADSLINNVLAIVSLIPRQICIGQYSIRSRSKF